MIEMSQNKQYKNDSYDNFSKMFLRLIHIIVEFKVIFQLELPNLRVNDIFGIYVV